MSVLRPDDLLRFHQRPLLFRLSTDDVQRSHSSDRTLQDAATYVIEVELAELFPATIDSPLGTYRLDPTLTAP